MKYGRRTLEKIFPAKKNPFYRHQKQGLPVPQFMASVEELGNGNPGALYVLKNISRDDRKTLLSRNIKGYKIWMLYKDVCGHSLKETSALISHIHQNASVKRVIKGSLRVVLDYLNT